jgi:hypothetical protein
MIFECDTSIILQEYSDIRGILSCYEFRTFWITWKDGHIEVGSGSEIGTHVLVTWTDSNHIKDTKYVSFGAWYDAGISWAVMHDEGTIIKGV